MIRPVHSNPRFQSFDKVWRVASLLAAVVAAPGGPIARGQERAPPDPSVVEWEPHVFEADHGATVPAELVRFEVPENRVVDDGKRIELAFVRFESTNPDPGPPIVYLAGGPGGSGTDAARSSRFSLFMALREVADVIAFDQRATGLSTPLEPDEYLASRARPLDRPLDHETLIELSLDAAREAGEHWRTHGVDLAAYNTRESADDLEALREVLNVDRISLWSISYGTHLALATLRYHPDSIARVVLAGAEGPDHTVKLPSFTEAQFLALEDLVADDPQMAERFPDLRRLVEEVLDDLEGDPVTLEYEPPEGDRVTRIVVGRPELERMSIAMLRDPSTMTALPGLHDRIASGDFSDFSAAPEVAFEFKAMGEAVDAASGMSAARRERFEQEAAESLFGGGDLLSNAGMAAALGVPDLGEEFRGPLHSEVPALFISGTLDGRTPVANAEDLLPGFPNAVHVVLENAGHSNDLFFSSPRILPILRDFLRGEEVESTRLVARPPRFDQVREAVPLAPDQAERLLGRYGEEPDDVWTVISLGTLRALKADGSVRSETTRIQLRHEDDGYSLTAVSPTRFYVDLPGWQGLDYVFIDDERGEVDRLEFPSATGTERLRKLE